MTGTRIPTSYIALLIAVIVSCCQVQQITLIQTSIWEDPTSLVSTIGSGSLPSQWAWLESAYQSSHFVELDHCSLDSISVSNFTQWVSSISEKFNSTPWRDEWTLQLLELWSVHHGLCNFSRYHPRLPLITRDDTVNRQLQKISKIPSPPGHARIAFTIIAYQDALHLQRLIEAIHMPHHYIIIHLEESTTSEFQQQVSKILTRYDNVVICQFGTILYKSDSVSRIQLQLMHWLVQEQQLDYDYHITLGGAVYPLWNASQLAQEVQGKNVYMGELTHNGMRIHHPQWKIFWKTRLLSSTTTTTITTQNNDNHKMSLRVGSLFEPQIPEWMDQSLQHKATSGNQAVYSRHVVQSLLQNEQVLHLFALAKYGCCCCIEERSWIAAMYLLGFGEEAKQRRSVMQLWGGDVDRCRGSMSNAVLDLNTDRCYRQEDPSIPTVYLSGNETWSHLVKAKENGVLFARKFNSDHEGSVKLMERMRQELHAY